MRFKNIEKSLTFDGGMDGSVIVAHILTEYGVPSIMQLPLEQLYS